MSSTRTPEDALPAGTPAPGFSLHDTPHSRVSMEDFAGRAVVLVFYVADWHPVATDQLLQITAMLPEIERLNASVVGISVDSTWSHAALAGANSITFPLLSDDSPMGSVGCRYGVQSAQSGRSRRALFVIDDARVVRWSGVFPDELNPGVDGLLAALESLTKAGSQSIS